MCRLVVGVLLGVFISVAQANDETNSACPAFLDHDLRRLHSSESVNLCELAAGRPMLVVNTASHCGYTGQFKGLEALHEAYGDKGLFVVGFASDDFRQEADTEAEAATICFKNFGVTFTMIAPGPVTGSNATPVFRHIRKQGAAPRWNFSKFILDADGKLVGDFVSRVKPDDPELTRTIESVL